MNRVLSELELMASPKSYELAREFLRVFRQTEECIETHFEHIDELAAAVFRESELWKAHIKEVRHELGIQREPETVAYATRTSPRTFSRPDFNELVLG